MIPIVEDYLSDLIEERFSNLKSNPSQIDRILRTTQVRLDRLKNFIQSKPVTVIRGYPITPAVLPCICILLSSEEETQEGLGDYGEEIDGNILETTEQVSVIDAVGSDYPFPYVKLTHVPVVDISQVVHNDFGTILQPFEYDLERPDLGVLSVANSEDGDMLTVTYTYKQSVTEQMEVMYESNYRLEVWDTNGDRVVELYHLLKWCLLSGRDKLVSEHDLFRQRLSGADFEAVTNMFPDFVYRRALSFWCQMSVTASTEESGFIQGIQPNQTAIS